jgi:uncharacterized membrane protein YphA (DoxX/SURF4 family)
MLGTFLIFMGLDKVAWFTDHTLLLGLFHEWLDTAPRTTRWYLETIAIPGAPLFARLVPLAELAAGAALVAGAWVRIAATLALLMIINFHFASDLLFHYAYLTNPYGLPVMGGLLALALGGSRLPFSVSR